MTTDRGLIVENLNFRYRIREDLALKDINLTFEPSQVVLVAGASGCGKTTLIRCINGLIPRSYKGDLNGRVLIDGEDTAPLRLAEISQKVGTVLQDPERQILGTKVFNEVAFGLENLGLAREEICARVDDALVRLKIDSLRNRDTFSLSGGEKQKVALAGVLAMRPGILLLDEPLASLDPASAEETLVLVRELADEGMAVILVEHRVEDVLKINPEKMIFLSDGRVKFNGRVADMDESIDYREVKLPAPMIIRQMPSEKPKEYFFPAKIDHGGRSPLVEFKNVSFSYEPGVPVIEDVSLGVYSGDIIALLGPNGAGKTTLVKHAIGLLKPKKGQVLIGERDTCELSVAEVAQSLGYVFQSPSHMLFASSVQEELAFGPRNLGHSKVQIREEVERALTIVNLTGMGESPPLSLSFGQQKRVSIAAVLAMQSRILVMDEPSAGQDYRNYIEFMDAILRLPNFDAVLFITHDIDLAVIYANRVVMVNHGQIVGDGEPGEVLENFDYLRENRLVPTTLLETNLAHFSKTGRFLRAEALAYAMG